MYQCFEGIIQIGIVVPSNITRGLLPGNHRSLAPFHRDMLVLDFSSGKMDLNHQYSVHRTGALTIALLPVKKVKGKFFPFIPSYSVSSILI